MTTEYEYDAYGRLATLIAYNAKGSGNGVESQATAYLYESPINASWQTAVVYPDSTDTISQDADNVWTITSGDDHTSTTPRPPTTAYDRMGRTVTTIDQRGIVHIHVHDTAGRLWKDLAIAPGGWGNVDNSIQATFTTYDDTGRIATITSYGDTSGTSPVNQIAYVYDGWGNLYQEYQEHDGVVDGSTLFTQYTYADGASGGVAKYVRLNEVTYPNDREIHYDYGTTGAIDDIMSRISAIYDDADDDDEIDGGEDVYASYKYLGTGTIVEENYEEAEVKLDYNADDNLGGFDRFGRVVDQVWEDYGASQTLDEYTYTYDRAGNRLTKDNELNAALDEDYIYDDLNRLVEWKVNDSTQQTWLLDSLGNDLSTGTYNEANEMTPTVGSSGYDAAGNMTTLQSGDTAVYDAWNRLVEVNDGEDIIQQNEYDGTNRRIQIFTDFTGTTPATTQDDYHRNQQVIETHENSAVKYQHIWSKRYIDALILRDTLSSGSIVTADRLFYLSDANYNVTGLVKYNSGTSDWEVVERYTYTPYGEVTYRLPNWTPTASSANNNLTLYTGRTLDLETDLMYYRARYYDPSLERFISRDPIGYAAGDMNLYRYVGNNPLLYSDPTGLTQGIDFIKIFIIRYLFLLWPNGGANLCYHLSDTEGTIIGENKSKSMTFMERYAQENAHKIPADGNVHKLKIQPINDIRTKYTSGWLIRSKAIFGDGGFWLNGSHEIEVKGGQIMAIRDPNTRKIKISSYKVDYVWHDRIDGKSFSEHRQAIRNGIAEMDDGNFWDGYSLLLAIACEGYWDLLCEQALGLDYDVAISFSHELKPKPAVTPKPAKNCVRGGFVEDYLIPFLNSLPSNPRSNYAPY